MMHVQSISSTEGKENCSVLSFNLVSRHVRTSMISLEAVLLSCSSVIFTVSDLTTILVPFKLRKPFYPTHITLSYDLIGGIVTYHT